MTNAASGFKNTDNVNSVQFNDPANEIPGAFTPTGLQNSESVGSVTLTYGAGGLAATSAAGATSTITPSAATGGSFAPANYNITYTPGTLTVTTAALSITANDDTKAYGDTKTYGAGSTNFTSIGLQNTETIGTVTITDTSSGGVAGANVGDYPLTPSAATGGTFTPGNYAVTYHAGTLTVQPALTITTQGAASLSNYLGSASTVQFVAKDSNSNILGTAEIVLTTSGGAFTNVIGVPANTATVSLKPRFYLRKKFPVSVTGNGVTLNLSGVSFLGGDANNDNQVQGLDYAWLRAYWGESGPVAGKDTNGNSVMDAADFPDLNGDGIIDALDYNILKDGWYNAGDEE